MNPKNCRLCKLLVVFQKALLCFFLCVCVFLGHTEKDEEKNVVTEANLSANLTANETLIDH